jgi:hypothetical protein
VKEKPRRVVELAEYGVVARELADLYYVVRQSTAGLAQKCGVELEAIGIDRHDARAIVDALDEEIRKILEEFAAGLRLPPKAEIGFEPEEGVEYRINNDMSELRRAAAEALRPTEEEGAVPEDEEEKR